MGSTSVKLKEALGLYDPTVHAISPFLCAFLTEIITAESSCLGSSQSAEQCLR